MLGKARGKSNRRDRMSPVNTSQPARPRIGYLVPQFPGQTHIFFWREIAELRARGVAVDLLSTTPPPPGLVAHDWSEAASAETTYLAQPRAADAAGLLTAPWGRLLPALGAEGRGFARDALLSLPAAHRLRRLARARGITHVHAHSCGRAALIAALCHLAGGPRYSLTLHGPMSDYGPGQGFKWRHAAFATIITEKLLSEARQALGADMPARVPIQPMGVDLDAFARPAPYAPWDGTGPLRLFSCGRLNVVKGHQDLVDAVALIRAQGVDARLEIAGEDDAGGSGFRHELARHIAGAGMADHVTLLGAIDAGAVRARLFAAHVFALASWHEPLGVAYMEAMAARVPTLGTDAGGVPELIRDGVDGVLVPPREPEALAWAILRIARDPALAQGLSDAGHARIAAGFSAARGAETLLAEIARL